MDKHLDGFTAAIVNRDLPVKDTPGYDFQQIDRLKIRERWGRTVDELWLEWEGDVAPNLNVPPHQLDGVVEIVHVPQQQHSPAGPNKSARHPPEPKPRGTRGTRGPLPEQTDRVANKIRDDIRAKRFTMREGRLFKDSRREPQKNLMEDYGCGKSTLLDALSLVWSEFETPTNSDKK
jgi:hypothetical protein